MESFYIRADEEVQFVPSVFTSPVSSAGPLLYHHAPWLCQSQTWALPSFSISSSTLPWLTPSSNTCASWTLTPNPPPHATPASSAPSVGQHSCLPDQSFKSKPTGRSGGASASIQFSYWPENVQLWCCFSFRDLLQGPPLALWTCWRRWSSLEWTLPAWTSPMEHMTWVAPLVCSGELIVQSHAELRECDAEADMEYRRLMLQSCMISHHFMYFSGNVGKAFAAHCLITLKEHTLLQPALYVKKVKAIQHQWWNLSPNMRYISHKVGLKSEY